MSEPTASSSEPSRTSKKKKKPRKNDQLQEKGSVDSTFPDDGVMKQLKLLDESDIVRADRRPNVFTISSSHGQPVNSSTTNGKVYLEVKGGFKAVDQIKLAGSRLASSKAQVISSEDCVLKPAVKVQNWFRRVATLSHGLLAGLALCQALTVWLLAPPHHTWQDFVEHYTYIAYPFYASSHFLLIICVISVFDRYDVCKFQWQIIRAHMSCGVEILTILLYPLALGVALMGADRDIRLGQFHRTNSTVWWEERQYIEQQLNEWKYLVLVKCLAAIVGWLLLGLNPLLDHFYDRLTGEKEA